jgi:hypothetical protein
MLKTRSIVLSLTVAAVAVLGAGCQRPDEVAPAAAVTADNTTEICDAFRHFEVDHLDEPAAGDSSFDTVAAADMRELAGRATDPAVSAQLTAITTQISVLAGQGSGRTYDQVELAHPQVFAAGGQAWVALEGRCGKAVIPTP